MSRDFPEDHGIDAAADLAAARKRLRALGKPPPAYKKPALKPGERSGRPRPKDDPLFPFVKRRTPPAVEDKEAWIDYRTEVCMGLHAAVEKNAPLPIIVAIRTEYALVLGVLETHSPGFAARLDEGAAEGNVPAHMLVPPDVGGLLLPGTEAWTILGTVPTPAGARTVQGAAKVVVVAAPDMQCPRYRVRVMESSEGRTGEERECTRGELYATSGVEHAAFGREVTRLFPPHGTPAADGVKVATPRTKEAVAAPRASDIAFDDNAAPKGKETALDKAIAKAEGLAVEAYGRGAAIEVAAEKSGQVARAWTPKGALGCASSVRATKAAAVKDLRGTLNGILSAKIAMGGTGT